MFYTVQSLGLAGIEPFLVTVEVDCRKGLPGFDIVGLPDAAVRESRERVKSAIQNLGYPVPNAKIIANLAPAGTRKQGAVYDLPILMALLGAAGYERPELEETALIGEIGLSGEIRGVTGVLPMVLDAKALGLRRVVVPSENATEAAVATNIDVLCATHAREVADWCCGRGRLEPAHTFPRKPPAGGEQPDLSDVKGQEEAKRALEVAAAGGHNLLLIGAPGAGKSMLARRLPSILPELTRAEAIEATKIHSVAGGLEPGMGLLERRPFRSPHHSVSQAALVGGGVPPRPGEASLAHAGVLFLDELPEFRRDALEVLRQPLEDGAVCIARVNARVTFPSRFMMAGAMNPCPCGYYGHPTRECACSPEAIRRYLGRISGPLLDRIDIQVEVLPVEYSQMASRERREGSAAIRERVCAARELQTRRFKDTGVSCNAQLPPALLDEVCALEPAAQNILKAAFDRLGLSARGYDRIRKVARTIADLDGVQTIAAPHVSQAIQFRSLDRKYWGG